MLEDGRVFPIAYALLVPPFLGADAVRACTVITTPAGFVKVNDCYQTKVYPEVFAAGVAVEMSPTEETPVPCGVPKLGYLSEQMAKIAAHNVVASIRGEELVRLPPGRIATKWVLDAGDTGVIITADHFLEPSKHGWLLPGPEAHWAKVTFEKYFMASHRHGWI